MKATQEASFNMVQIYLSDQQIALYKLDVLISFGTKLNFHQALDEFSFVLFVRYKRSLQESLPKSGPMSMKRGRNTRKISGFEIIRHKDS